jgi:hypothetical protein
MIEQKTSYARKLMVWMGFVAGIVAQLGIAKLFSGLALAIISV